MEFLSSSLSSGIIGNWEQEQRIKLGRLRQQRQRMDEMKEMASQFSRVVRDLQLKNKFLLSENQRLQKCMNGSQGMKNIELQNLKQQYLFVCNQLERERKMREDCQNTIKILRKQLTSPHISIQSSLNQKNQLELDFQALLNLHEQAKDQIFLLEKENITLKQVIREQSKASYGRQAFWKQNHTQKSNSKHRVKIEKENRPGVIRTSSLASLKEAMPKEESMTRISATGGQKQLSDKVLREKQKTLHETKNESKKSRIKELEAQIRKQTELIQKYRQSEGQQIKLIDLLKSQKTKICACHSQGSSKKLATSKGVLVSFKKDSVDQSS